VIELTISATILISVLLMILSLSGVVGNSFAVTVRSSEMGERTRNTAARIAGYLRPASVGSLLVPAGGLWIAPLDGVAYPGIRFQPLANCPTVSSSSLGPAQTLVFARVSSEAANGIDDNSNGLIDEGDLELRQADGLSVTLASGVEEFAVRKTARTLELVLRMAARDGLGNLHRFALRQPLLLTNN
jgi:hypothetical protein